MEHAGGRAGQPGLGVTSRESRRNRVRSGKWRSGAEHGHQGAGAADRVPRHNRSRHGPASSPAEKEALAAFQAIQKANQARDVAAWEKLSAPDHTDHGAEDAHVTCRSAWRQSDAPPPTGQPAAPGTDQSTYGSSVKGDLAAVTWTAGTTQSLKVLAPPVADNGSRYCSRARPSCPGKEIAARGRARQG